MSLGSRQKNLTRSRWLVVLAMLPLMGSTAFAQLGLPQQPLTVQTRFGPLSVGKDSVLLFRGRPLQPRVRGNNSLDLGEPYRIGTADVVFVINEGGTLCPYLYHFVTVTRSGAKATPAFGTCAELTKVERSGDTLRVYMPGFRGPFEPEQDRRKAARERHVFVFRAGTVTENGRPAKRMVAPDVRIAEPKGRVNGGDHTAAMACFS